MTAARFVVATMLAACLVCGGSAFGSPPSGAVPAAATTAVASRCGDFLAELERKPEHARFVECRSQPERQGRPLRAVYRVEGRYAAAAEAVMIAAFGLEKLRRQCCHWEAPPRWVRLADGREFSITMTSDETTVSSRADWADIPTFEIVVETLTESI